MEPTKINFFIIKSFDDLVFTLDDVSGYSPEVVRILEKISPHRSRMKFEEEFGGDGTEASVVYGGSTYSSKYGSEWQTFEVMYSDEDEPRGWQTKEEINDEFLRRSLNKTTI